MILKDNHFIVFVKIKLFMVLDAFAGQPGKQGQDSISGFDLDIGNTIALSRHNICYENLKKIKAP